MLLLTVKGREASFAVVSMTVGPQLRMRDIERFCGIFSSLFPPLKKEQPRQEAIEEN